MFFREQDAISGKMASAYATIDGRVVELFWAKGIEATAEKNVVDVPILGRTSTGKRAAGWSGSGTLTVYYVSPIFRRMMLKYMETGEDTYFDLLSTNEQPGSAAGVQAMALTGCNIDSVALTMFDASSDDMLEEEIPFTFSGANMITEFNEI
ncbi:MAG: phage tail tube protein [Aerococcus urinaeequi]